MTAIAIQGGKIVLRDGKVGTGVECCCDDCDPPCRQCEHACLEATFSGFSGTSGDCDCADLNGTYLLTRGSGYRPRLRVQVFDEYGADAVIELDLAFDATNGTYYVDTASIEYAGVGYSENPTAQVIAVDGVIACNDPPVLSLAAARIEPPQQPNIQFLADGGQGVGARLQVTWSPENVTAGEETWSVGSFTIASGGRNFKDRDTLRLYASDRVLGRVAGVPFVGRVLVDRAEPVVDEFTVDTANGFGATFSHTWDETTITFDPADPAGSDNRYWHIDSFSVVDGGADYAVGEVIYYTLDGPHQTWLDVQGPYRIAEITSVDGNGAITGVSFNPPEESHIQSVGTISQIIIVEAGEYFGRGGVSSAQVIKGGTIWPSSPCLYSLCQSVTCGETTKCRRFSLLITATERTLTVTDDNFVLVSASLPAENNLCDDLTFTDQEAEPSDCTFGTVTVAEGACDAAPAVDVCCEPEGTCVTVGCGPPQPELRWVDSPSCGPPDAECNASLTAFYRKHCNLDNPNETSDYPFTEFGSETGFNSKDSTAFRQQGSQIDINYQYYLRDYDYVNSSFNPTGNSIGAFFSYSIRLTVVNCAWEISYVIITYESFISFPDNSCFMNRCFGSVDTQKSINDVTVPRGYCIDGSQERLAITFDIDGVTVGGSRFTFAADGSESVIESGENPELAPDITGLVQPMTFVIRPRICENPLP